MLFRTLPEGGYLDWDWAKAAIETQKEAAETSERDARVAAEARSAARAELLREQAREQAAAARPALENGAAHPALENA